MPSSEDDFVSFAKGSRLHSAWVIRPGPLCFSVCLSVISFPDFFHTAKFRVKRNHTAVYTKLLPAICRGVIFMSFCLCRSATLSPVFIPYTTAHPHKIQGEERTYFLNWDYLIGLHTIGTLQGESCHWLLPFLSTGHQQYGGGTPYWGFLLLVRGRDIHHLYPVTIVSSE